MTLKPEIKKFWTEDLRSGEYNQVEGELCGTKLTPDDQEIHGHCCLGVLLEGGTKRGFWEWDKITGTIILPAGETVMVYRDDWEEEVNVIEIDGEELPEAFVNWVGLSQDQSSYIHRNDGWEGSPDSEPVERLTFNGIANFIEENE
jgi:hypothetical protein